MSNITIGMDLWLSSSMSANGSMTLLGLLKKWFATSNLILTSLLMEEIRAKVYAEVPAKYYRPSSDSPGHLDGRQEQNNRHSEYSL